MAKDEKSKQDKPEKKTGPPQQKQRKEQKAEEDQAEKEAGAEEKTTTEAAKKSRGAEEGTPPRQERDGARAAGPAGAPRRLLQGQGGARADAEVRLQDRDAGAAAAQDHPQHGRGRNHHGQEDPRQRALRHDQDRGSEAGGDQVEEVDRQLQGPRQLSGGRQGAARRGPLEQFLRPPVNHRMPRIRDFRGVSNRAFDG